MQTGNSRGKHICNNRQRYHHHHHWQNNKVHHLHSTDLDSVAWFTMRRMKLTYRRMPHNDVLYHFLLTDSKKANTRRPDFILDLGPGLWVKIKLFFFFFLEFKKEAGWWRWHHQSCDWSRDDISWKDRSDTLCRAKAVNEELESSWNTSFWKPKRFLNLVQTTGSRRDADIPRSSPFFCLINHLLSDYNHILAYYFV